MNQPPEPRQTRFAGGPHLAQSTSQLSGPRLRSVSVRMERLAVLPSTG